MENFMMHDESKDERSSLTPDGYSDLQEDDLRARLQELMGSASKDAERLVIKSGSRMLFVDPDRLEWIEADKDYVRLHVGRETHLVRDTMNSFERKLDPHRFIRVHRSTIVNLDFVKEMKPLPSGEYAITLRDGTPLTLSRGYRERLQSLLKNAF